MSKLKKLSVGTKKALIICLGIFLIIFVIVFFYFRRQYNNYSFIKINKNQDLVYTIKSDKKDRYFKDIPYINIKSEVVKEINDDIDSFTVDCFNKEMCNVSYEYNYNSKVLSLLVKQIDYGTSFAPIPSSRSYNLDLKELKLIDDMKLLELFETDEYTVEQTIEKGFRKYYSDILKAEYYDEKECDYDCFLGYRDVDNYLDNVSYYINNNKLIAYRPFTFYSIFGEEEYFKEDHFRFTIKES